LVRYKPARPALVTAICLYEIVLILIALLMRSFDRWLQVAHPALYRPTPFSQIIASELSIALALLAAILLWRLRPAAAYVLAIRAVISLSAYLIILMNHPFSVPTRPPHIISPTLLHGVFYVIGLGTVALNISIAWYAYSITARHQRGQPTIVPKTA
jgi:hypothetical protein